MTFSFLESFTLISGESTHIVSTAKMRDQRRERNLTTDSKYNYYID